MVDVELARALERRGPEVCGEEDAVEQLRALGVGAALPDDALDLGGEALEAFPDAPDGDQAPVPHKSGTAPNTPSGPGAP